MWDQLLSTHRIGSTPRSARSGPSRSEFHKDYDRIIFSSAFRRLSDKTQVVPFPQSDYTRQRLTHSLEVSCVGRSLATSVYEIVRDQVQSFVSQGDFEAIVAAACLAHDIGNPPFGHFGERAIQDWAKALPAAETDRLDSTEYADLTRFEGNAQSFRVLTRLQMSNRRGGMRLTAATLGALVKYPRSSDAKRSRYKKHGCFAEDRSLFDEVFETCGRPTDEFGQYARHPLALLSEAADDICYAIIDLEDGCKSSLISAEAALETLEAISPGATGSSDLNISDRLSMGRAIVINVLVTEASAIFEASLPAILEGSFTGSLVQQSGSLTHYDRAKKLALEYVFNSERVLELEAAGYKAIQGLLSIFQKAVIPADDQRSHFDRHVCRLVNLPDDDDLSVYQKLLGCTDKVSGMTDRYCVELFQKLSGMANS